MSPDDLDGRVAEGWGGDAGANGSHVNIVLGRRGTPTAAAMLGTLTTPRPGHTPIMVVVGEDQPSYEPVWPPTIMINKATATADLHVSLTWGAAQLGIAQGVLDAVADGLLEPTDDVLVFVCVYVDPAATDATAIRNLTARKPRSASATASAARRAGGRCSPHDAYAGIRVAAPPSSTLTG